MMIQHTGTTNRYGLRRRGSAVRSSVERLRVRHMREGHKRIPSFPSLPPPTRTTGPSYQRQEMALFSDLKRAAWRRMTIVLTNDDAARAHQQNHEGEQRGGTGQYLREIDHTKGVPIWIRHVRTNGLTVRLDSQGNTWWAAP